MNSIIYVILLYLLVFHIYINSKSIIDSNIMFTTVSSSVSYTAKLLFLFNWKGIEMIVLIRHLINIIVLLC